jgi:hypothetical protein
MKGGILLLLVAIAGQGCSGGEEVDPNNPSRLEIAGRVTRAEDGEPLPGIQVWLAYPAGLHDGHEIAYTASDGSYELIYDKDLQIASCEGMVLYVHAEGYQASDFRDVQCISEVQREDFVLVQTAGMRR